jgi:hypothetical protein
VNREISKAEVALRQLNEELQQLGCRTSSDPWQPLRSVKTTGGAGDPGPLYDVGCANVADELQVCVTAWWRRTVPSGDVFHTIRFGDGQAWQPFGWVLGAAGQPWPAGQLINRVTVGGILADPPAPPPPENPECSSVRAQVAQQREGIVALIRSKDGLDPRRDRTAILEINNEIALARGTLRELEDRAASLGCS